jgi:putative FmdB family regulatory protein
MPIYEFQCNKCGKVFEQLVLSSDNGERYPCPGCGKGDTCRLLSTFSCSSSGSDRGLDGGCGSHSGGFS